MSALPGTRTPHSRRRAVGGLFAGLAVGAAAVVVLPGSETPSSQALTAASLTPSSGVAAPPAKRGASRPSRRASRGGARTALPPVKYVSKNVPTGSSFSGQASWYGGSFQGQRTANGESFNTNDLTAASKTQPFGTRLRVCSPGHCVVVRVNDRGPYVAGRILDLSKAARDALGYDGVAAVTATPVETKRVAVRRRPVAHRPAAARSAAPMAASAPVSAAGESPADDAPSLVLVAALLTLGGGGVLHARRYGRPRHPR